MVHGTAYLCVASLRNLAAEFAFPNRFDTAVLGQVDMFVFKRTMVSSTATRHSLKVQKATAKVRTDTFGERSVAGVSFDTYSSYDFALMYHVTVL